MHWIRVDRYFQGDPESNSPRVSHQVVACHHCENAPCEQVCPVAATVHSHEGLNDMVYNRCVGTRYCANNCPYKVRRFNYFYYHGDLDNPDNEVKKMVFNPEVTVRTRGVMEKCTFCVQRIQAAKIDAKNERRPVRDGEIQTACQQACPTRAIEFGDLNNRESQVAAAWQADRAYAMLAELNVKPRISYLAKIRNPNPELEDAEHEHDSHSG
jgi:molybdopterin-containing oxidoreductase family iron-sulfur binding subunit